MNPGARCLILTYHSISEGRSPLKISPSLFREQIAWLKTSASIVSLEEAVDAIACGRPLPSHTVVLTFDDGFADFHTHAVPVLLQAKCPATVFLPTAFCGRTNRWPGQPAWVDEQPLLGWNEIRELSARGFSFGAHSVTHPDLTKLAEAALRHEIAASQQEIESRTGRAVTLFCYPYGYWNAQVRTAVSARYRGACSTITGMLQAGADRFVLPRVDVHLVRNPGIFRQLFSPGFPAYLLARRTLRRLRGQPESAYGQ